MFLLFFNKNRAPQPGGGIYIRAIAATLDRPATQARPPQGGGRQIGGAPSMPRLRKYAESTLCRARSRLWRHRLPAQP